MDQPIDSITSLSNDEFRQYFVNVSSEDMPFNYYEPMNLYRALLIAAYCLLFGIGVAGNLWVTCVIGVVLHQTNVNPSANETPRSVQIYILSLCSVDLLVILLLIFLISDLIYGQWMFPQSTFLCRLYLSGEFLNKFAGPILLSGLAAYCYACICLSSPSEANTTNDRSDRAVWKYWSRITLAIKNLFKRCGDESGKAALIFVAITVGSVFILVAPIYVYGDIQYLVIHKGSTVYTIIPKCALQTATDAISAFTLYGFIFGFIAPSTSFTFFYVSILIHVRRHNQKWRATAERSLYFWRVAKVTGGLVSFYLGCWTPYWIMNLYIKYFAPHPEDEAGDASNVAVVMSYFIHMLPYINCTGYPILYTVLNRNIKASYSRAKALRQRRRASNVDFDRSERGSDSGMCGGDSRSQQLHPPLPPYHHHRQSQAGSSPGGQSLVSPQQNGLLAPPSPHSTYTNGSHRTPSSIRGDQDTRYSAL